MFMNHQVFEEIMLTTRVSLSELHQATEGPITFGIDWCNFGK